MCELFDNNRRGHLKEDVICLQAMSFDVAAAAKIKYIYICMYIFFFFLNFLERKKWNDITSKTSKHSGDDSAPVERRPNTASLASATIISEELKG